MCTFTFIGIRKKIVLINCIINVKMSEYGRVNISEGIDISKINASKECDICHYWYLLDKGFKHEPYICHGRHDLIQKTMDFNDVAIFLLRK